MQRSKSRYKIVPTIHKGFGNCWALKDADLVVGVFVAKEFAENRKLALERLNEEQFLLQTTKNQPLVIVD